MNLGKRNNKCISIVLPVYNAEKSIENAIQSVLQQSYTNYELIVVDDGSIDRTSEVIKKYSSEERVRIIKKSNGGVSSARNIGINRAKGDYLMFLDSDDRLMDNCLTRLVEYIENYKEADLIIFGWKEEGSSNTIRKVADKSIFVDVVESIERIIKTDFGCGGGYPWNKLWRVNAIKNKDIIPAFNEKLILCEDKEWTVRLLLNCKRVLLIPDVLYIYHTTEKEHLAKVDFNIIDENNNKKIMSFMMASIYIEQMVEQLHPQTELFQYANRQNIQDIILVCFKAIRNNNDELLNLAAPYYKQYIENIKNRDSDIPLKYWIMLRYIHAKLFITGKHI